MGQPITSPDITDELRAALGQALSRHFALERRIVALDRQPVPTCSSFALEELEVRLDDDSALQLIFKDISQQGMLDAARHVKPSFLYDPLREIETYRVLLAPSGLGMATYYGAVVDQPAGRYWLFLEKVSGLELYYVDFPIWQQVARWLAAMHSYFAAQGDLAAQVPTANLLKYDGDFYRTWMRRAQRFSQTNTTTQPSKAQSWIEWLATRYDRVVERLIDLPVTLIHGEFYASNVIVQGAGASLRVCPIDWETAAIGPGLIDLAALTAGSWTDEEQKHLAMAYYETPTYDGRQMPTPDVFLTTLDYCHLHQAVQWLGWSQHWLPPPEHAQNWLGVAMRLAEKLGI